MDIKKLKKSEGSIVEYFYRGKYRKYELAAVQLEESPIYFKDVKYNAELGYFRLNYIDNKTREWDGFWSNKIDRIKIL